MIWLAAGLGALLLGWWLLSAFATASVPQIKRGVLWFLAGVLLAAVAALLLTRRLPQALGLMLPLLPFLLPALRRRLARRRFATTAAPEHGVSTLETATLAMRLDQGSGTLSGRVRAGRFAGRELGEMPLEDCLALLEECRATDAESVPLLEAWLDRAAPGWRQAAPGAEAGTGTGTGAMDRAEALALLQLEESATAEDIRAAHRRLMRQAHPDHGGDSRRAARLNQARDLLLRSRR
jgi:hypothetical protein